MTSVLTKVQLRVKMNRLERAPNVLKCAMVQSELKRTGQDSSIVKGYLVFNGSACPHYWVESGDSVWDIQTHGKPEFFQRVKDIPDDTKVVDEPDPENTRLYDMYVNEPKDFWTVYKKSTR